MITLYDTIKCANYIVIKFLQTKSNLKVFMIGSKQQYNQKNIEKHIQTKYIMILSCVTTTYTNVYHSRIDFYFEQGHRPSIFIFRQINEILCKLLYIQN